MTQESMPRSMQTRWRCADCQHFCWLDELLVAPNPFDQAESITGCPKCKAVNEAVNACDEPGCMLDASCGWPSAGGGYRRTCHRHSKL